VRLAFLFDSSVSQVELPAVLRAQDQALDRLWAGASVEPTVDVHAVMAKRSRKAEPLGPPAARLADRRTTGSVARLLPLFTIISVFALAIAVMW